jgi:hypothetical protein
MGNLNFSKIEARLGEKPCTTRVEGSPGIALSSTVDWNDRTGRGDDGKFNVLVISNEINDISEASTVKGWAYIVPSTVVSKRSDIKSIFDFFSLTGRKKAKKVPLEQFSSNVTSIESLFDSSHIAELYRVRFTLLPGGLTYLKLDNTPEFFHLHAEQDQSWRDNDRVLCRQAFYFLKYALHEHLHHPFDDDSVSTTYYYGSESQDPSQIGKALLQRFYDSIGGMKSMTERNRRRGSQYKGVISFGRALIRVLRKTRFINDAEKQEQLERLDNMEGSFAALVNQLEHDHIRRETKMAVARTFAAFLASLIAFAFLFLHKTLHDLKQSSDVVPAPDLETSSLEMLISIERIWLSYPFEIFFAIVLTLMSIFFGNWIRLSEFRPPLLRSAYFKIEERLWLRPISRVDENKGNRGHKLVLVLLPWLMLLLGIGLLGMAYELSVQLLEGWK